MTLKTLESVNQTSFKPFPEITDVQIAGDMVFLPELLVNLITRIEKLVYHAVKTGTVALLILGFQTYVVQTDIERGGD